MSLLIEAAPASPIDAAECLALAEAARVDPSDEAGFVSLAPLLAGLAADGDFLARAAVAALEAGGGDADRSGWGAQVLLLAPPGERFVLRASLWPGEVDAILADSGPAAFSYGMAHDHDFGFLTCGYAGPGYRSDEWEVDADALAGLPGEAAALRPLGRHRLAPGDIRFYRAHRDIHAQRAPERFSVSLNLLARGNDRPWLGQHRYDLDAGCIAAALGVQPAELLLEMAIRLNGGDGLDTAVRIGGHHPSARKRIAAWRALAAAAPGLLPPLLARGDVAADRVLAAHARTIAAELDRVRR